MTFGNKQFVNWIKFSVTILELVDLRQNYL